MAGEFLNKLEKSVDLSFEPTFVIPGEDVTGIVSLFRKEISIGQGLVKSGNRVVADVAGTLRYREPAYYWIDHDCGKYIAKTGDQVVGIIEERTADFYRVNIFSDSTALLNRLAFEGATKRNKPELKIGDTVYCRVALAHKDLETELTCISATGSKKGWSTAEAIYGQLAEGIIIHVSTIHAKLLLRPDCVVLNVLGRHIAYEVTIGMNGVVWIKAASVKETIVIRNAILNAQALDAYRTEAMVEILVQRMKQLQQGKN